MAQGFEKIALGRRRHHNDANGESNREDQELPADARDRQRRADALAGDEFRRTQRGNNNAWTFNGSIPPAAARTGSTPARGAWRAWFAIRRDQIPT